MRCEIIFLGALFGGQFVLAWTPSFSTYTVSRVETLSSPPSYPSDCGHPICGGECGDGIRQPEEECDLGAAYNGAPNSGCTSDCKKCPVCGDGQIEGNEECDAGDKNGALNSGCSKDCKKVCYCGDGNVDAGEECDAGDQNGVYQSGCSKDCRKACYCGDENLDAGEECDAGDQNGAPGSGCSKDCKKVCYCGDGKVDAGEQCDAGNQNGVEGSGCSKECKKVSVCGNGVQEGDEECDKGKDNGAYNSGCSTDCKICGYCGDGIIDAGEECDNGWRRNGSPGNTCSSNCTLVHNYPITSCSTTPIPSPTPPAHDTCGCETCNPISGLNFCTTSTSCISTPHSKFYCACRAGYRADNLSANDPKQFRLPFSGQEYRVFVAPGVECNTLCNSPFPGPDSCREVPVQGAC